MGVIDWPHIPGVEWISVHTIDWVLLHGVDWAAVGSVGAILSVLVAAVGIIWTLRSQGRIAQESNRIANSWQLANYWDGSQMREWRVDAARAIVFCGRDPDILEALNDVVDVLNFFEHLGYLLKRQWVDTETAYVLFADWTLAVLASGGSVRRG